MKDMFDNFIAVTNPPETLPLLTEKERHVLLEEFNSIKINHAANKTVIDLFEEQAALTPDAPAIVFEEQQLTYKQLNEYANQLAHFLRARGVTTETLVPICIERSPQMIIGVLGIIKAGGAYVPIDPEYPAGRIQFMLADTQAAIAVSSSSCKSKLQYSESLDVIELDEQLSVLNQQSGANLENHPEPNHLIYIIYTSGSTGKPKGVMIEHKGLVNLCFSQIEIFQLKHGTRMLQFASFGFDASCSEIFTTLLSGGCLVLPQKKDILSAEDFEKLVIKHHVEVVTLPPSYQFAIKDNLGTIKTLMSAGEPLNESIGKYLQSKGIRLLNGYGPTENTIGISMSDDPIKDNHVIVMGKPIANIKVYILDNAGNLCPVGVTGEICVGGVQVARGYLNRPDLTAEKFVADPFAGEEGARMYKTGDLGRWHADGNIEFLGRADDQVKIRGYRIELGEVENVLHQCELVNQVAVLAKDDKENHRRLIGYIVPDWQMVKSKQRELFSRRVDDWKEIAESEFTKDERTTPADEEFDITGWNDSFTGKAIPADQMREWLQDIVEVILSEPPGNVLEIGCGTGLIYYQLAGKVEKYIGADFSKSCVNQIRRRISEKRRNYGPTELQVCAAHEVSLKEGEQVDTVLLNSIVQYFPGEDYLTNIIKKSISFLKGSGRIIIGDVRDNRLLKVFKSRLDLQKLHPSTTINEFKWAVEQDVLKEEELCFSPEYFYRLQLTFPEISHVEIQWKKGAYINELTLYRYTVVLHLGTKKEVIKPEWQLWEDLNDIGLIINRLERGNDVIALKNVPNARLRQERLISEYLLKNDAATTIGDILNKISKEDEGNLQVEQILSFAQKKGYNYRLLLNEDPLKVNVLIQKGSAYHLVEQPYSEQYINSSTAATTNIPLFTDISTLLKKEVKSFLQKRLPEYMIPSELITVGQLPQNNSGKVDRKFLSQIKDNYVVNKFSYQAPRTEVEQRLTRIWKKVLSAEDVSILDNFFDLGGTSTMAIQVVSQARRAGYSLQPSDFFNHQNIEELARVIEVRLRTGKAKKQDNSTDLNGKERPAVSVNSIVTINKGTKVPFFFTAPGFSVFDKVTNHLDKDQPFYFFIPLPYKKVEDIAAYYIQEMKKIQPEGPYCLGAYCDFGEVALEMAQQLTAKGEKVTFLALFDFYHPTAIKPINDPVSYYKERLKYYYSELKSISVKEKVSLLYQFAHRKLKKVKKRTSKAVDLRLNNLPKIQGYLIAKNLYTAKPYNGKVLLFRSTIRTAIRSDDPYMGWYNYFTGKVELYTIDGNHKTMFNDQGAVQIAEKLKANVV